MFEDKNFHLVKVEPRGANIESYDLDLLLSTKFKQHIPPSAATLKLQVDIDNHEQHVALVIEGKPALGEHMVGKEIVCAVFVPIKTAREHLYILITRLIHGWELLAAPILPKEVLEEKLG